MPSGIMQCSQLGRTYFSSRYSAKTTRSFCAAKQCWEKLRREVEVNAEVPREATESSAADRGNMVVIV